MAKLGLTSVALAIVAWNVVLTYLQLWPNESPNWLMGAADLDGCNL